MVKFRIAYLLALTVPISSVLGELDERNDANADVGPDSDASIDNDIHSTPESDTSIDDNHNDSTSNREPGDESSCGVCAG
ncbi:hypothetical protein ATCC90586_010412 [Pythium insidiosum]|nr:hypothetical protein ATCC90586_010412 [Pythium insidiosum]